MKKTVCMLTITLAIASPLNACLNTISNNTSITFKLAEVKAENADLKQQDYLPEEYVKDEEKAHTLLPGEEIAFGGHYVPTFIIYKEYPDKKWHPLLVVKQLRCGPRGPENKYLLMTDLFKRKLPDDYQEVYKFSIKCDPSELNVESTNEKELTKVANPYQELYNTIDDFTQKIQELFSRLIKENNEFKHIHTEDNTEIEKVEDEKSKEADATAQPEDAAEESCDRCNHFEPTEPKPEAE